MELVTGRAGSPHITSQQDRQKHQGVWGTGAYILKTGNNLEPVVQSSNSIQIKDGALMSQGTLFSVKVGTVDEVTIANGSQGMMRKDVIVARYTYNQGTNTENAEWAVVQGTPAASNPQIPQITEGDIQAGDATVDTSVFIVTLDGINITSVDVVPELAPDKAELKALLDELNGKTLRIATHSEKYTVQSNSVRRIELSKSDFEISNDTEIQTGFVEVRTSNPSLYQGTFNPYDLVLYIANNHSSTQNIDCIVYLFYTERARQ